MPNLLNKFILKFFNISGFEILKKEDVIKLKLDDLKKALETENKFILNHNETLLSYFFKKSKFSKSQLFQDLFVDFVLKKKDGFYCEVGAFDGVTFSNTYYLEKELNWTGILCEPNTIFHSSIKTNRSKNILIKKPIFNLENVKVKLTHKEGGRSFISSDHDITNDLDKHETTTLNAVFKEHLKNNLLDYLSVDTEGSEYEILKDLNFELYSPQIITVEHNYDKKKRNKIYNLLVSKKYKRVFKNLSRFEDWYILLN
jgi:FkbM family methyltransferase